MRAAAWLALALVAGCSFDRRSTDFSCGGPGECTGARACVDGFCVDLDAGPPDAMGDDRPDAAPGPDAFDCPPSCTSCVNGTCLIDCNGQSACGQLITCPVGVPCQVSCGRSACNGGIDCSAASSCEVICNKTTACGGPITCGAAPCQVQCTGQNACTDKIDCQTSCQCDTICTGMGACAMPATCPGTGECTSGNACISSPAGCDSC